jgi:hypothetical protein
MTEGQQQIMDDLKMRLPTNLMHFMKRRDKRIQIGMTDLLLTTPEALDKLEALGVPTDDLSDDSIAVNVTVGPILIAQREGLIPEKYALLPPEQDRYPGESRLERFFMPKEEREFEDMKESGQIRYLVDIERAKEILKQFDEWLYKECGLHRYDLPPEQQGKYEEDFAKLMRVPGHYIRANILTGIAFTELSSESRQLFGIEDEKRNIIHGRGINEWLDRFDRLELGFRQFDEWLLYSDKLLGGHERAVFEDINKNGLFPGTHKLKNKEYEKKFQDAALRNKWRIEHLNSKDRSMMKLWQS